METIIVNRAEWIYLEPPRGRLPRKYRSLGEIRNRSRSISWKPIAALASLVIWCAVLWAVRR